MPVTAGTGAISWMVFERMLRLVIVLFSEYWIGNTGGFISSLAPSPPTMMMPDPAPVMVIWLPIICRPFIEFSEAVPTPVPTWIADSVEVPVITLFAIKVSSTWLFVDAIPDPAIT